MWLKLKICSFVLLLIVLFLSTFKDNVENYSLKKPNGIALSKLEAERVDDLGSCVCGYCAAFCTSCLFSAR